MEKTTSSDSTAKLQDAIHKLEAFSKQTAEASNATSMSKTISLMRALLVKAFDNESKVEKKQRQEVLHAVEEVNRQRLLIQKLKKGNPAEQKLADSFTKVIDTYNNSRGKNAGNGLTKFFSKDKSVNLPTELPTIIIPEQISEESHYPDHISPEGAKRKIFAIKQNSSFVSVPQQSAELFHMKALTLLERYGIASNHEARMIVKHSPILTLEEGSKCTLAQTLTLFPGQTIVVMGTSELDPKTHTIHKLFPETFSLSIESTPTGYPHPSQRAGWTLGHQLLPEFPQRIDLLDETCSEIFIRKKQATPELLHHGSLIGPAKNLLKLKKQVFNLHCAEFVQLHQQLAYAFLGESHHETIEHFFEMLAKHPQPFDYLNETNQILRDHFISKPHQMLFDAILKGKQSHHEVTRFEEAKSILEMAGQEAIKDLKTMHEKASTIQEKLKWGYITLLGPLFGEASNAIILQYLSEYLIFAPATLTPFQQKVQVAAYQHIQDFLDELMLPTEGEQNQREELVYNLMKEQLSWDIALFNSEMIPEIAGSLETYFQQRYHSLKE